MSTAAIVLLVLGAILLLLFIGGLAAARRRTVAGAGEYAEHVAAADQALEEARATDRGWDRERMEALARGALAEHRPGWRTEALHLVLVEDLPGVREDRAHFMAEGSGTDTRIVLERGESGDWSVAKVE
jgi:hypothetical protein